MNNTSMDKATRRFFWTVGYALLLSSTLVAAEAASSDTLSTQFANTKEETRNSGGGRGGKPISSRRQRKLNNNHWSCTKKKPCKKKKKWWTTTTTQWDTDDWSYDWSYSWKEGKYHWSWNSWKTQHDKEKTVDHDGWEEINDTEHPTMMPTYYWETEHPTGWGDGDGWW
jgi:hypothetical protein